MDEDEKIGLSAPDRAGWLADWLTDWLIRVTQAAFGRTNAKLGRSLRQMRRRILEKDKVV